MSDDRKQKIDPRIEWILDKVSTSLKVKGDKLNRITTDEACKFVILSPSSGPYEKFTFFNIITLSYYFIYIHFHNLDKH